MGKNLVIIILLFHCINGMAQQGFNQDPGNPNMDMSAGNFGSWQISWGNRSVSPYENLGTAPNLQSHTVVGITGTNFDGMAGPGNLPRVPSGLQQVARLGAPSGGGYGSPKSYAMSYDFTVNANFPILYLQVATIMDPTHDSINNTHFYYQIFDQNGNKLTQPCGGFRMHPEGRNAPATHNVNTKPPFGYTSIPGHANIIYQPWQSIAMDFSARVGQTLTIKFEHYDCYTGYHGSYSYISAAMRKPIDTLYFCRGAATTPIEGYPRFKSYAWSNGNTTQTATIQNPMDGDVYTCTVESYNGCQTTFTYVLKEDPIQADFSFVSGGCTEVIFTDESTSPSGAITNWAWQFGDAANAPHDTSFVQNPTFIYSDTGSYSATLSVTSPIGCTASVTYPITVTSQGYGDFLVDMACMGSPSNFTDLSVGNIISRLWSFGDGNTSTALAPTHTYNGFGNYTVTLVTENSAGCIDTITKQINVLIPPIAGFSLSGNVCAGTPITVTNNSINAGSYIWDLGNGQQSTEQAPIFTYSQPGTYTVTLTAVHANGCIDSAQQQTVIYDNPTAAFSANPTQTTTDNPLVSFSDESVGATSWNWDFGDGTTATEQNPTHSYSSDGVFGIVLIVQNQHQCSDTATSSVSIVQDIIIPNVFTPNGDGSNDVFEVTVGQNANVYQIRIYSRWGNLVFTANEPGNHWDGTINGKDATDGVYFYHIKLTSAQNEKTEYKGSLTLIR